MKIPSDSTLLTQIQTGNEEALLTLHARYANLVYSVAHRIVNDAMAAEEVTQDTFMRLWHKSYSYDESKGTFATWLLAITRHLALDTYRKQRRDPLPLFTDSDPEQWENLLAADDHADLRRALTAAISELPEDQRGAIELAYFQGLTHSEIADQLQVPLGTIKTRIRLGMQKLRAAWSGEVIQTYES
jgi:RNA polymerase sigma-70 factor (ECF subfamily)